MLLHIVFYTDPKKKKSGEDSLEACSPAEDSQVKLFEVT